MKETKTETELLTIPEAAVYLNTSHWTVRKWIRQKYIPYIQVNSRVIRIEKGDLETFLSDKKIPAKKI